MHAPALSVVARPRLHVIAVVCVGRVVHGVVVQQNACQLRRLALEAVPLPLATVTCPRIFRRRSSAGYNVVVAAVFALFVAVLGEREHGVLPRPG